MQLIGMLDSPYVRRTAISLEALGLRFEHKPLSVFSTFAAFQRINPLVKAPTLVCDDGTVLMDSTLIIDYAEALAGASLMPAALKERTRALRVVGLALAACDKAVQLFYEYRLRPPEKQHEPWISRVREQLLAGFSALDAAAQDYRIDVDPGRLSQPVITAAVNWHFAHTMLPDVFATDAYPALRKLSAAAEATPIFELYPREGPGVRQT